jgi:hypothetical protein
MTRNSRRPSGRRKPPAQGRKERVTLPIPNNLIPFMPVGVDDDFDMLDRTDTYDLPFKAWA